MRPLFIMVLYIFHINSQVGIRITEHWIVPIEPETANAQLLHCQEDGSRNEAK